MVKDRISAFDGYITLTPSRQKGSVRIGNAAPVSVLAETANPIILEEGSYPPVCYVPRQDVDESHLVASDHRTKCPYKGEASYLTYKNGDVTIKNIAWLYEDAIDEVAAIRGYVAFDTRYVDVIIED